MRILIVASTFPAHDDDPIPAFVKDQIKALKQAYPELIISVLAPHDATSHTQSYTTHEAYDEYRFHYIWPFRFETLAGRGIVPALQQNPARYILVPFLVVAEFFALLRLIRKTRPAVIYAHWFTPQGITAGMASRVTGVPFVYTSHSSDVAILRKVPIVGPRLVRHFTKQARAITVVSRRSLGKLRTFFTPADWRTISQKVAVIPMGVNLAPGNTSNEAVMPQQILFMGRLAEKKGVQYLLPAFAEVVKIQPAARLVIAGDGPLQDSLRTQAATLGFTTQQVHFSGYVSGNTKAALLAASDVFVVPSIITASGDAEGLPVSLMEGLAAGKICIATNESGADDILTNGKDGYLIPQKDTTALVRALKTALSLTPEARAAMRKLSAQTARQFSWDEVARAHYAHLLSQLSY